MKRYLIFALMAAVTLVAGLALAATSNPSPASSGYTPVVIPIMGQYTSSRTGIVKFTAPSGYRVVNATATARASSGTTPTLTVDLKSGSTSMFSTPVAVTAGAIATAVLGTAPNIADESTVSVDLAIGGTTPVWEDITLFMLLKRR